MTHYHRHLHHHLGDQHTWLNFFYYVAYAILVLGISLIIAALAFEGNKSNQISQNNTISAQKDNGQSIP